MCDTLFFWKGIHQNIWFKFFHFISFLQLLTSSFLNFFEWHSLFYQESEELKRAMWTFLTFQKVRSFDLAQYKRNISTHSIYLISGNKEVKIKGRGYGGPVVINTLVRCKFFQWVFFYGYRYQVPSLHPTTSFQTFMIIYLPTKSLHRSYLVKLSKTGSSPLFCFFFFFPTTENAFSINHVVMNGPQRRRQRRRQRRQRRRRRRRRLPYKWWWWWGRICFHKKTSFNSCCCCLFSVLYIFLSLACLSLWTSFFGCRRYKEKKKERKKERNDPLFSVICVLLAGGVHAVLHERESNLTSGLTSDTVKVKLEEACKPDSIRRKRWLTYTQCDQVKVAKCQKKFLLEKWKILTPLQKLPKNVGVLGKIINATGFEKLPKVQ